MQSVGELTLSSRAGISKSCSEFSAKTLSKSNTTKMKARTSDLGCTAKSMQKRVLTSSCSMHDNDEFDSDGHSVRSSRATQGSSSRASVDVEDSGAKKKRKKQRKTAMPTVRIPKVSGPEISIKGRCSRNSVGELVNWCQKLTPIWCRRQFGAGCWRQIGAGANLVPGAGAKLVPAPI